MRRLGRLGLLVLLLALSALLSILRDARDMRPIDAAGRRVHVADGDTLRIGDVTIRLAGIDAVERDQFCRDGQGHDYSCGISARRALEDMVGQGGLRCVTREQDKYRRSVAHCSVTGIDDVGAALIDAGWAVDLPDKSDGRYAIGEAAARSARRGIWKGTFERPWDWRARNKIEPRTVQRSAVTSRP